MSTRDYLKELDYDQLLYARNVVDQLLKEKDAEPRVGIWVVSTDIRNVGGFREHEYKEAVKRAHEAVDYEAKDGQGFVVMVEKLNKRESEVPEMLALTV